MPERDPLPKPDDLLRLDDAARLCFPHGRMTASALRCEARKGRLATYRVAGKDYTTPADCERMKQLCRILEKAPGSGSKNQDETATASSSNAASGASETDQSRSALDSARARIAALSKMSSPTISGPSGKSPATATVIRLKS